MNRLLRRKPDREPYTYFDNSCTGVYDSACIACGVSRVGSPDQGGEENSCLP
ncbi:MAG: hypothetical protein KAI15_03020 [Gammaproteobacteria bacterium]|nr:hypothetical protein [Gammaproteobacteria bacterium]